MIEKKTVEQFLKFVVVGVFSTLINYSLFYVLYSYLHWNYMLSSALGFIGGVLAGYLLNKSWTFSRAGESEKYILKYFIVYTVSLGISLLFLKITVENFQMDARIANVLCIGITTITNFIGIKLAVFRA